MFRRLLRVFHRADESNRSGNGRHPLGDANRTRGASTAASAAVGAGVKTGRVNKKILRRDVIKPRRTRGELSATPSRRPLPTLEELRDEDARPQNDEDGDMVMYNDDEDDTALASQLAIEAGTPVVQGPQVITTPTAQQDRHHHYDPSSERGRRALRARRIERHYTSTDEKRLWQLIAMRGFQPLMPAHWTMDFPTLPSILFTADRKKTPINSVSGKDFRGELFLFYILLVLFVSLCLVSATPLVLDIGGASINMFMRLY